MNFRLGGIGAPGAMVFAGLVLTLFAVGFTAMTRYVPNSGAFYVYAVHGIGRGAGIGLAFVLMFSYLFLNFAFYAFTGFFTDLLFASLFDMHLPWSIYSLVALIGVGILGARQVDVGAKLLAVLVTVEVGILAVLSVAVLVQGGPAPASFESFNPSNISGVPGTAAMMVLGFGAYLSFEGTAIYSEEAKDPRRTVPRATYFVVIGLALLYGFTFWILTYAFGPGALLDFMASDHFEGLVFAAGDQYLRAWASATFNLFAVTSFLACAIFSQRLHPLRFLSAPGTVIPSPVLPAGRLNTSLCSCINRGELVVADLFPSVGGYRHRTVFHEKQARSFGMAGHDRADLGGAGVDDSLCSGGDKFRGNLGHGGHHQLVPHCADAGAVHFRPGVLQRAVALTPAVVEGIEKQ